MDLGLSLVFILSRAEGDETCIRFIWNTFLSYLLFFVCKFLFIAKYTETKFLVQISIFHSLCVGRSKVQYRCIQMIRSTSLSFNNTTTTSTKGEGSSFDLFDT